MNTSERFLSPSDESVMPHDMSEEGFKFKKRDESLFKPVYLKDFN